MNKTSESVTSPLQSLILKWLRKQGINIVVALFFGDEEKQYEWWVQKKIKVYHQRLEIGYSKTLDEAFNQALKWIFENLLKNEK